MANKMYKDRLIIVGALRLNKAANGLLGFTIPHTNKPAGCIDTEEEAETFPLKFATEYIDGRTK